MVGFYRLSIPEAIKYVSDDEFWKSLKCLKKQIEAIEKLMKELNEVEYKTILPVLRKNIDQREKPLSGS